MDLGIATGWFLVTSQSMQYPSFEAFVEAVKGMDYPAIVDACRATAKRTPQPYFHSDLLFLADFLESPQRLSQAMLPDGLYQGTWRVVDALIAKGQMKAEALNLFGV